MFNLYDSLETLSPTAIIDNGDEVQHRPISKLSIIIPAYNEERTILRVLDKVLNVHLMNETQREIILVNDCSTDKTDLVLRQFLSGKPNAPVKYIQHSTNQGKGAAIHTGIKQATGEYILVQDADLEYDPGEYNNLLRPVINGFADVVFGSRFMGGNPHRILFFWHSIGNRFLTFLSNMFLNLNLTDMETGYKLIKTDLLQQITLQEKRFGFEPEVTAMVSKLQDVRIYEVGISYYGRTYKEGKKIKWRDGIRTIYCIVKYGLKSPVRVSAIKSKVTHN